MAVPDFQGSGQSLKPKEYLIWTTSSKVAMAVQETKNAIRDILGSDVELVKYSIAGDVVTFWLATLTDPQREQIGGLQGVLRVERNEPLDVDFGVCEDEDELGEETGR